MRQMDLAALRFDRMGKEKLMDLVPLDEVFLIRRVDR